MIRSEDLFHDIREIELKKENEEAMIVELEKIDDYGRL